MRLSHDELTGKLRELPRRAVVVFALRCAKRAEPLQRYQQLLPDAYSAGVEFTPPRSCARYVDPYHTYACAADADHAATRRQRASLFLRRPYACAADADHAATVDSASHAYAACGSEADDDLEKLLTLNLGGPGEEGEAIRWNDPRLGPLWPAGEPEWYVEAEKACRELEEKLRALPDPNAVPISPVLAARLDNQDRVTRMWAAGKFAKYKGEYVISDGETVFAHGKNLVKVWEKAEKKVRTTGKRMDSFTEFYVP